MSSSAIWRSSPSWCAQDMASDGGGWTSKRAALRAGKLDLLEEVTRTCLEDGVGRADILHYRTTLLTLAWRRGDAEGALADALALAQQLPGTRLAHAHAWIAASATR